MRGLYWCVLFIAFSLTSPLNPHSNMEGGFQILSQINMLPLLHVGEGGRGDEVQETQPTLIYINTATQTITAYDPQTDTHTPIFTCPEACYDPSTDQNGRIGFVTDSGFGIFDPISGDYTQFSADFGVYGYKGGVAFRSDLAYVAYEGRFNMRMRLLLTDLSTGDTTDLGSSGVGNPAWSWDNLAVLVSDGYDLFIVPIDGGDIEMVEMSRYQDPFYVDEMDLFSAQTEDSWFFRGNNNGTMGLYLGTVKDYEQVSGNDVNSALITYSVADRLAWAIFFSARAGDYTIAVVEWETGEVVYTLQTPSNTTDIAISPDNRYVAWLSENPDMGFGFYDLWIADLSAPNITPTRIAENISAPSTRPSGLAWMRNE